MIKQMDFRELGSFEEFATMEMDRLNKKIEQLTSGSGGIMEMKQTIADKEAEIARLQDKCDKQAMILRRLTPENHPDTLFISGIAGERDMNNMPEKLLVVPAYGCDFAYVYQRTEKTTGPEW